MHPTEHGMDSIGFRALPCKPEDRIAGAIDQVQKGLVAGLVSRR
ncbi:MAG: hypothetical protein U5R48_17545 [Gammaproteobacteria bacterium]|nr:hypothetical protein [Gammaproteobacteria bacterium]